MRFVQRFVSMAKGRQLTHNFEILYLYLYYINTPCLYQVKRMKLLAQSLYIYTCIRFVL